MFLIKENGFYFAPSTILNVRKRERGLSLAVISELTEMNLGKIEYDFSHGSLPSLTFVRNKETFDTEACACVQRVVNHINRIFGASKEDIREFIEESKETYQWIKNSLIDRLSNNGRIQSKALGALLKLDLDKLDRIKESGEISDWDINIYTGFSDHFRLSGRDIKLSIDYRPVCNSIGEHLPESLKVNIEFNDTGIPLELDIPRPQVESMIDKLMEFTFDSYLDEEYLFLYTWIEQAVRKDRSEFLEKFAMGRKTLEKMKSENALDGVKEKTDQALAIINEVLAEERLLNPTGVEDVFLKEIVNKTSSEIANYVNQYVSRSKLTLEDLLDKDWLKKYLKDVYGKTAVDPEKVYEEILKNGPKKLENDITVGVF